MGILLKKFLRWYYNFQLRCYNWDCFDCAKELNYYTAKSTYLKSIEKDTKDFYNKKLRDLK